MDTQVPLNGFLCVDKPAGITSRDAVNHVQRMLRPKKVRGVKVGGAKVGHAGTLDPMATGVLVLAVGRSTKLISYVQRMPKRYLAEFQLGKVSDTEDCTGQVETLLDAPEPSRAELIETCRQFVGQIQQMPPAYSALKVAGKRAYALARSGQEVQLAARPIVIHDIQLGDYTYPQFQLDVLCGSGTYIRSLGRDIGISVNSGAMMTALRRTRIGCFRASAAVSLDQLQSPDDVRRYLYSARSGVVALPWLTLSEAQQRDISVGKKLNLPGTEACDEVAALDSLGQLQAVLQRTSDGLFRPAVNFAGV